MQFPQSRQLAGLQKQNSRYWQVFLLCLGLAAALFLPHCIIDAASGGFFHYAGDFNDQQIPFYAYANSFIKAGGSFSWATDLGSGFANAYSFYLLGSPFFWLTMLLPARLVPWVMVPMLCLKFALAGGGAYLWMRRYTRDDRWAVLGGCLYAFSGFSIYNIFFNHFLDVVALFPYMLAALDEAVLDGKRGKFTFWVALNLVNSYFFFAGQAVFLIIYFVCMLLGKKYKLTKPLFGRLAFETLLGCGAGCVLLVPAVLSLLQNPRTIDPFSGYGYLVYGNAQQYLAILYSAFIMPDAPYLFNMFDGGILKWTSLTAYLPVVGIAGGLAFCRAKRKHPFTRILKVCVLCAFVPVLNSMFYALNSSYYARWYYMPLLILCAASVAAVENSAISRRELPRAVGLVAVVTLSAAAFALVPVEEDGATTLGVVDNQLRFWGLFAVSVLGVGLFALLLHLRGRTFAGRPHRFFTVMLAAVVGFSFLYGSLHISITKYGQWQHDGDYVQQTYGEAEALNAALPDDEFYRIDAYKCYNNMGLWLDKSCIQFFNSTVAPHILEFYPSVGVKRDVNSKPDTDLYALRGLLSVRFTLVPKYKYSEWKEENAEGWMLYDVVGSYYIYENLNYVPMGFTYDYYITSEQFEDIPEKSRGNILMRALLLDEEQAAAYSDTIVPLPEQQLTDLTYNTYTADCDERRQAGVEEFTATSTGFTAAAQLESAQLVLFSVPYDDGFSATVNGEPAVIEKVDNGLMAVLAPAGSSEIVFTYRTPGLGLGAAVSAVCLVLYAAYLLWLYRKRKAAEAEKYVINIESAPPESGGERTETPIKPEKKEEQ